MEILLKPVITEKMTAQSEKFGRYGFIVDLRANKIQIKEAVEGMYGVTVETVNTMNHPGKSRNRYTKTGVQRGRTNAYKKAIVTLAEGDIIDFFSNV
ncbi:MAG: 50S ribosomal protein L23 [Bacteroidota bacterium]